MWDQMAPILLAGFTLISGFLTIIRRNDAQRIKRLEGELSVQRKEASGLEKRVERCEEDRKRLREELNLQERERGYLNSRLSSIEHEWRTYMQIENMKKRTTEEG